MEDYIYPINFAQQPISFLNSYHKGNKSWQAKTSSIAVWVDSDGHIRNAADDSIFNDLESYIFQNWEVHYYYTKSETDAASAIAAFINGSEIAYRSEKYKNNLLYCFQCQRSTEPLISLRDLSSGPWYILTDAY